MPIIHRFQSLVPDSGDPGDIGTAEWNDEHADTSTPQYHGAAADGVTDDAAAMAACMEACGTVELPAGVYYASELPPFTANGQAIVGAGMDRTTVILGGPGARRASTAPGLRGCRVQDLTLLAADHAVTTHGQQLYLDETALDFSGISHGSIRNVYSWRFATHLKLDYVASAQTYYNYIEELYTWGGAVGTFIGGSTSPRDGANDNTFVKVVHKACALGLQLRGARNKWVRLSIENPSQASGYPATAIGIQFDSGYYAVDNVIDAAVELVGAGNDALYYHYTGLPGWVTPNRVLGGPFSANGQKVTPKLDSEVAGFIYGQHLEAHGLYPTRLLRYTPDGTLVQETVPNGGGVLQTDAFGATVYSAS